jgi:hypothetical protein
MALSRQVDHDEHGVNLSQVNEKMTTDQLFSWLAVQLNRTPEPFDLYHIGSILYEQGYFGSSAKLLQLYVDGNGSELPGNHLLGHAEYMLGNIDEAVTQLKKCVNSGFDSDWQLLIELQVLVDRRDMMNRVADRAAAMTEQGNRDVAAVPGGRSMSIKFNRTMLQGISGEIMDPTLHELDVRIHEQEANLAAVMHGGVDGRATALSRPTSAAEGRQRSTGSKPTIVPLSAIQGYRLEQ